MRFLLLLITTIILLCSFVLNKDEQVYYPSGKLQREKTYHEACKCDSLKEYFESGSIQHTSVYKHLDRFTIVPHGDAITYFTNGIIMVSTHYKNGKHDGKEYSNYSNGKLAYEKYYKDDIRIGTWKYFNENGSLMKEIDFTGTYKSIEENGDYGVHKFYDHDKLTHIITYDLDGQMVNTEIIDKTGYDVYVTAQPPLGKKLFTENCTICHSIDREFIGPALKGVTRKHDDQWLKKWISDAEALKRNGDKKALELDKKYPANQPSMTYLKDKEIEEIIDYLKTMN